MLIDNKPADQIVCEQLRCPYSSPAGQIEGKQLATDLANPRFPR